ncbi:MAG: tetratricopeptide repeat protein [Pyrinomonadaceae bacterium]
MLKTKAIGMRIAVRCYISLIAATTVMSLLLCACGKQPAANGVATANVEPSSAPDSATLNAATNAPPENVDLSPYNANIQRSESEAEKSPGDEAAQLALAKAYLSRAKALTKARQYRAALDDYRRVLLYDPDNEEAPQLSAGVMGLLESQGQTVPTEGNDPAPLGITPDTIAGGDDTSASSSSNKGQSAPARKKGKQ